MITPMRAYEVVSRTAGPYWSPVEAISPAAMRELQTARLREQVAYVWAHNAWYRRKWEAAGVSPDDIQTLDDVRKLPYLTKDDMRQSQAENPPYGLMCCDGIDARDIVRIAMTSGTTGDPVLIPFTASDYYGNWLEGIVRCLWANGVRPGEVAHPAYGFTPFIGLAGAYDAMEHLIGALVIPGGAWDTKTRLAMIPKLRITMLLGTPTYLLYLGRSAQEAGIDPRSMGIKKVFCTGEPGPMSVPSTRTRLQELWGCPAVDYSGTQETEYFAWECPHGTAHLNDDLVLFEVLDPDTQQPVAPGQPGQLVVTDLVQKTHPLLRFPTGDLVGGIEPSQCACGRTLSSFKGFMGRTGDVVKVRGVTVSVAGVENIIRSFATASDQYEIVATTSDRTGMDEVMIQVEPAAGIDPSGRAQLKADIEDAMKTRMFISMHVDVVDPGTLPIYELKARRFRDLRQPIAQRV